MIIPVRCFTCGKVIADKWRAYVKRVAAEPRKDDADDNGTEKTARGKILDDLGLESICCRSIMLTHVDLCLRG
jgi:DNA-directed RNA polymerase subunit N